MAFETIVVPAILPNAKPTDADGYEFVLKLSPDIEFEDCFVVGNRVTAVIPKTNETMKIQRESPLLEKAHAPFMKKFELHFRYLAAPIGTKVRYVRTFFKKHGWTMTKIEGQIRRDIFDRCGKKIFKNDFLVEAIPDLINEKPVPKPPMQVTPFEGTCILAGACFKCGSKGHLAKECKKTKAKTSLTPATAKLSINTSLPVTVPREVVMHDARSHEEEEQDARDKEEAQNQAESVTTRRSKKSKNQ